MAKKKRDLKVLHKFFEYWLLKNKSNIKLKDLINSVDHDLLKKHITNHFDQIIKDDGIMTVDSIQNAIVQLSNPPELVYSPYNPEVETPSETNNVTEVETPSETNSVTEVETPSETNSVTEVETPSETPSETTDKTEWMLQQFRITHQIHDENDTWETIQQKVNEHIDDLIANSPFDENDTTEVTYDLLVLQQLIFNTYIKEFYRESEAGCETCGEIPEYTTVETNLATITPMLLRRDNIFETTSISFLIILLIGFWVIPTLFAMGIYTQKITQISKDVKDIKTFLSKK